MNPDTLALYLRYESGTLSDEEALVLYQRLIQSGDIWSLAPQYLSEAARLIRHGVMTNTKQGVN